MKYSFQLSCLGEKRFENSQTANLNKILIACKLIYKCLEETQNKDEITEDVGQTQLKLSKNRVSFLFLLLNAENVFRKIYFQNNKLYLC